jgi:hypothetical protein
VVSGYYYQYDQDVKKLDYIIPGASVVATAQDGGIFLRALSDASLLNGAEQAIYSSIYVHGYTGLLPGYQSIARYHKDIDTVVVQFVKSMQVCPRSISVPVSDWSKNSIHPSINFLLPL